MARRQGRVASRGQGHGALSREGSANPPSRSAGRPDPEALSAALDQLEGEKRIADALVRFAEEAGGTLALPEVLDRLCRLSREVLSVDRASIFLWSQRRRAYVAAAHRGIPESIVHRFEGRVERPGDILHERVLGSGEIVVLARDGALADAERRLLEAVQLFALAMAPLPGRGRPLGAICVGLDHAPGFSEPSLKILRGIARQGTTLIDNARLFDREERARRLRERVAALSSALADESDPFRIGRLVCAEGADLFRVNGAILFVREGDFLVACGASPAGGRAESVKVSLDEQGLVPVQVFHTGEPIFENAIEDAPPEQRLKHEFGVKSALCIPLIGRTGPLGCLGFLDTGRSYRFAENALEDARLLGAIATSALERARLFRELFESNAALRRSEEHFRSLIELGSDVITVLDGQAVIRYESPSIERVLGYHPEELLGRTPFEILHPEDREGVQVALGRVAAKEERAERVLFRIRHKDGSWRALEGIGKASPGLGVVVNSRDVTERQRTERALREEGEISAALARVGELLISSLDAPVILERLCRVTTEVLGCTHSTTWLWRAEEQAFAPIAGYVDPPELWESLRLVRLPAAVISEALETVGREDLVVLSADLEAGLLGAILQHYETPVVLCMALRRGSEVIGIQTAAQSDRNATFSPSQLRIARGIAQLASTALANAQLVAELERVNQLKSEFVSTMSHELRTPLNVILGFLEMVRDARFSETERGELYDRIEEAGRELLDLIEGTLTVGKVESGRDEARFEAVPLAKLWNELRENCARLLRAPGVDLMWCDEVPVATFRTDLGKLKVIVRNLVGNALKFTERGSVRAELGRRGEELCLTVADTGIGIQPEDHAAIFEMFRQADGSDTRRFGGSGLGLYIVRRFVHQLGGSVALESTPGRGSVFEVRLPLDPPSTASEPRAGEL